MNTVYSDFYDGTAHSFDGKPHGDFVGYHAMVLIGSRADNDREAVVVAAKLVEDFAVR